MSGNILNPSGDYEHELEQRVNRGEAIAEVHSKLLLARHKDVLLRDGDAEGSYRHVQRTIREYSGVSRMHMKMLLVPERPVGDEKPHNDIVQLAVEVPTLPRNEVSDHIYDRYLINAYAQQVSSEILERLEAEENRAIPLQVFFATATKRDGSNLSFVLGSDSIRAFDTEDDIVLNPGMEIVGGQEYSVVDTMDTIERQRELEESWFTVEQLRRYVRQAEPIAFGGYSSTGSA